MDALDPGSNVGGHTLQALLGSDPRGSTWRATTEAGATVVLRLCPAQDGEASRKLLDELAALQRVSHPGVIGVLGGGEDPQVRWIAVEDVDGPNLKEWAAAHDGVESGAPILACFAALADALAALHDAGLLHTHLRPEWIRVRADGSPVILDLFDASPEPLPNLEPDTRGDARYRAPELILGTEADRRVDVYALGAMLYEAFANEPPHGGADDLGLARCTLSVPPLEVVAPTAPPQAAWVVARALQMEPADRPATMHRIAHLLRRQPGGPPTRSASPPAHVPRFVGRGELVGKLTELALSREGGPIVLHGPRGIGLTRLLREVRGAIHVKGGQHVLVQGGEDALLQALEQLAGPKVPAQLRRSRLGADETDLHGWFPSLRPNDEWSTAPRDATMVGSTQGPETDSPGDGRTLGEESQKSAAAARLLMRAASQRPMLVAVDDADRTPISQLRTLAAAGLLLLGTHRPSKVRMQKTSIEVPRLLPNEMAEIARSIISAAGPTLAWSHASELAGLPGPLVELARSQAEAPEPLEQSFDGGPDHDVSWPEALQQAEHALAHSSPAAVLQCMARPATPMPATGVLRHRLEIALARAHFQRGDDQSSMVHAALAAELAPTSVDRNRARLDAARSALRSGHYSACLSEARAGRAEAVNLEDADLDARWATLQARTLDGLGRLWEARRVLRQLLSRADLEPASRQGLRWTAAEVSARLSRDAEAAELITEARNALEARPAPRISAGLLHVVGQLHLRAGRVARAHAALEQALQMMEGLGDPELESRIRSDLSTALTLGGGLGDAARHAAVALTLADASGSRVAIHSALLSGLHRARLVDDTEVCKALVERIDALPATWKGPREGALIRAEQALGALVNGQVHRAREAVELSTDLGLDDPHLALLIRLRHAEMAWHLGIPSLDEAVALTVDAIRQRLAHIAAMARGIAIASGATPKDLERAIVDAEARGDACAAAWLRRSPADGDDGPYEADGYRFRTPVTELASTASVAPS